MRFPPKTSAQFMKLWSRGVFSSSGKLILFNDRFCSLTEVVCPTPHMEGVTWDLFFKFQFVLFTRVSLYFHFCFLCTCMFLCKDRGFTLTCSPTTTLGGGVGRSVVFYKFCRLDLDMVACFSNNFGIQFRPSFQILIVTFLPETRNNASVSRNLSIDNMKAPGGEKHGSPHMKFFCYKFSVGRLILSSRSSLELLPVTLPEDEQLID